MKKKNNRQINSYFRLYLLASCIVLAVGSLFFYKYGYKQSSSFNSHKKVETMPQLFTAKYLKFQIKLPQKFRIIDEYTSVLLSNNYGEIIIGRNGTNFDNLESYVSDLSEKNKIEYRIKENFLVSNLNVIKTYVGRDKIIERVTYFIYSNYAVYSFSTSSPELYSDLDAIVRSFKVLP